MSIVRVITQKIFSSFGLEIKRKKPFERKSLRGILENIKRLDFSPKSVIDIGAAFGGWSQECAKVFPDASYILVEPLVEYQKTLEEVAKKIGLARLSLCAITRQDTKTTIYVHNDLVGSSIKKELEQYNQEQATKRVVEGMTLDTLLRRESLEPPFFIKLDIQGAEIEALKAALETLKKTEALIAEVSLLNMFSEGYEFYDVITFMKERGFVVYDLFGLCYRPIDHALCQVDVLFVPIDSNLRQCKHYATKEQRDAQDKKISRHLQDLGIWNH